MISTPVTSRAGSSYWCDRAVLAHRTWAAEFEHHYYIMQDGDETKATFSACAQATVGGYTQYSCKGWPHAVVAPQCSGAYYGPKGPCCKMDDAILFALRAPCDRLALRLSILRATAFAYRSMIYVKCKASPSAREVRAGEPREVRAKRHAAVFCAGEALEQLRRARRRHAERKGRAVAEVGPLGVRVRGRELGGHIAEHGGHHHTEQRERLTARRVQA